jgi:ABC-2 type transport system permease protein
MANDKDLAMTAFWTTEYYSVFALYYFPETFFSGRFFPLLALPAWVLGMGTWLPFKYTVAFPAEMLLGKLNSSQIGAGFLSQCAWIAVFVIP